MKNPNAPWKSYAVGRYRLGDTIRSDQYRFSEYTKDGNNAMARMLYNHATDPDETVNISERPDNIDTVAALTRELRARKGKPALKE